MSRAKDATVDGGANTDTIRIDSGVAALTLADADFTDVLGVETLALNGTGTQAVTLGAETNLAFAGGITITTQAAATSLNLNGAASTVSITATGTDNADTLTGGTVADTLVGGAGNDTISGGTGDDQITGGTGGDVIDTGLGTNLIVVNGTADIAAGESYTGGGAADTLSVTADTNFTGVSTLTTIETFTLAQGVDTIFDAAALNGDTIAVNGTGDNSGETMTVNGSNLGEFIDLSNLTIDTNDITGVTINGLDGTDIITGTNGADTIDGGIGDDQITGGAGDDQITGSAGADVIDTGLGTNLIVVNGTADITVGESYTGGGVDTLSVTAITNFTGVSTLTSIETITLAQGVGATFDAAALTGDTIVVNGTGNNGGETLTVNGTAGVDTIDLGNLTIDTNDITAVIINGLAGNDIITGSNGDDQITGGAGADTILSGIAGLSQNVVFVGDTDSGLAAGFFDVWGDFASGMDNLDLGAGGDATGGTGNYVEVADAAYADLAAVLVALNADALTLAGTSAATELYIFANNTNGDIGYVGNDIDGNGTIDQIIQLTGVNAADISAADFV